MSDITENICEAIDIITTKKIETLSCNKTLICLIEDDKNKDKGEYLVSNGATKFLAYSQNVKYEKGNSVYVIIPNNDLSEKKIIIGYHSINGNKPFSYQSPLNNFVPLLSFNSLQNEVYSLSINDNPNRQQNTYKKIALNQREKDIVIDKTYTKLGISCQFKTNLESFRIKSGIYGIEVNLMTDKGIKHIYLSSDEMLGTSYNFYDYVIQEKLIDITDCSYISSIDVKFFQNNNFIDDDNHLIKSHSDIKNLFIKNFQISFGYDIPFLLNNQFLIYSDNGTDLFFPEEKIKVVSGKWIYLNENAQYTELKTIPTDMAIYWFKENTPDTIYLGEKQFNIGNSWGLVGYNNFQYSFSLSPEQKVERIRAVLVYQNKKYDSNILTLSSSTAGGGTIISGGSLFWSEW